MCSAGQCHPVQMSAGDTPRQMCARQDDEAVAVGVAPALRVSCCDVALIQCVRRVVRTVNSQRVAVDVAAVALRADVSRYTRIRIRP